MTLLNRVGVAVLGTIAVTFAVQVPLVAQESVATKATAPAARKKGDPARRVPSYFGQIGLTTEQRASIYGVQEKHLDRIEALEKQIETEKAQMIAECEGVLNETQKKLLENLRRAAAASAKVAR